MITATYPPSANGVAVSTKRTVTALRAMGHRVVVVGPDHGVRERDYIHMPTVRSPFFGIKDYPIPLPQSLPIFLRRLPTIPWDIVHVHHPVIAGPFAQRVARSLHVPAVFTYHTQYDAALEHISMLPKSVVRWYYQSCILTTLVKFNGIIATTKWLKKRLEIHIPHVPIYYGSTAGLSTPFFVNVPKPTLRKTLHVPIQGPMFLCVSRLSPEKKTEILLRGFILWARKHSKGTLVIVGDGINRAALERIARESSVSERILFVGKIANESLPSWFSAADVFLYSSITDTIGINILEAMSSGLPVVAPSHETTREIIITGTNGVLYEGDDSHMPTAIDHALRNRKKLSKGARISAREYDIATTTKHLIHIYETVSRRYRKTGN